MRFPGYALLAAFVVSALLVGCGSASRPEPGPAPRAPLAAEPPAPPVSDGGGDSPAVVDAGTDASVVPPPAAAEPPRVKVVTIGMHVGGGPFDEATKEPFKKAVEPHFPELAECWAKHVAKPPKQADVGVDLLIEASGGHPAVSNPRANFDKGVADGFVPCVVAVFASVEFAKLVGRGRTGVSYSVRFTRN